MSVRLITYDLRQPGRNYNDVYEGIKQLGSWWHCLESIWLVSTTYSCSQIRDHLKRFIDANDDIVVLGLNENWATHGLSDECNNWLKNNLGV